MSQKQVKKLRKNVRNELNQIFEDLWKEPFGQRFIMATSILAKKNYLINKVNRRKR